MARTPEQVAADDALTTAIDAVHRAYDEDTEGVLTGYVLVAKRHFWDSDGDSLTAVHMTTGSDTAISDQLGMLEYASTLCRKRIAE
ncbi:hypothetical protein ATM97_27810 [Nocardia sp. MH4]|uniref:hypothetical protein n=1 Tax=Nocardia sp. MH4 TaxID=1768677 RepID=UPI001C4F4A92|nr:hypothetical protein [Nocardia sp. MH4]MBW0275011.1 hypothetical protein [Nocardia sp. MH4]